MPSPIPLSYDDQDAGLFSCHVAIAGDPRQVVVRDASEPVSLPEIYLLKFIHGEASVTEIVHEDTEQSSPGQLRDRLVSRYGATANKFLQHFPIQSIPLVTSEYPDRETADEIDQAAQEIKTRRRKKAPAKKAAADKTSAKVEEKTEDPQGSAKSELPDL